LIDLVFAGRQMAAADQREFPHDRGRHKQGEAFFAHLGQRVPKDREMQQHRFVFEIITAKTAGLHARFDIDQIKVFAQLDMVFDGKIKDLGVAPGLRHFVALLIGRHG